MGALVFGSPEAAALLKADREAVAAAEKRDRLDAAERAGRLMRDNGYWPNGAGDDDDDLCDHLFRGASQKALCGAARMTGRWDEWRRVWGGLDDCEDLCTVCQVEAKK